MSFTISKERSAFLITEYQKSTDLAIQAKDNLVMRAEEASLTSTPSFFLSLSSFSFLSSIFALFFPF